VGMIGGFNILHVAALNGCLPVVKYVSWYAVLATLCVWGGGMYVFRYTWLCAYVCLSGRSSFTVVKFVSLYELVTTCVLG
jgi:hypothetical protein